MSRNETTRFLLLKRVTLALAAACVLLASSLPAAEDLQVTAEVSQKSVNVGARIAYTISIVSERRMPDLRAVRAGLPPLEGLSPVSSAPSTLRQSNTVNWVTTHNLKLQWTLTAQKEGTARIGPTQLFYDGQRFDLPSFEIQVVGVRQESFPAELRASGMLPANTDHPELNKQLAGRLFAQLVLSDHRPYLQETIVATCVVYGDSLDLLRQLQGFSWDPPSWTGFFSEPADIGRQLTARPVRIGGKEYQAVTIGKTLLTPTSPGKIAIPMNAARCLITIQNRRPSFQDDFFRDPFFQNFDSLFGTRVEIRLPIAEQAVQVQPLPMKNVPASFQNAVGQFSFAARVDRTRMTEDDLLTLFLEVGGEGYLGSVSEPKRPDMPDWREVGTQTRIEPLGTLKSAGGKKTFEILLRPEKAGKLLIPAVVYAFFDPEQERYVEHTGGPFEIEVAEGQQRPLIVASGEGVPSRTGPAPQFFGDKLAYIHTDLPAAAAPPIYQRPWHLPLQFLPLVILGAAAAWRARRDYRERHADRLRVRSAGSRARRELKEARAALTRQDLDAFHARLAEALRDCVATKLRRSPSGLTLEEIERGCLEGGVAPERAAEFRGLLETCDRARYLSVSHSATETEARWNEAEQMLVEAETILRELDKAAFEK